MFLYTASADTGIHVAQFETETGKLSASRAVAAGDSFFLACHPAKRVLYSLSVKTGCVAAFAIEADGALTPLNEADSRGAVPCHLAVDPQGRFLAVANYNGGVALFPLRDDGSLEEAPSVFQPEGSGVDKKRQDKPHPHGVTLSPGRNLLHVADLGTDTIRAFDIANGQLQENVRLDAKTAPGAGPRHMEFSPEGNIAIAVNELDNTLSLLAHDRQTGALKNRQDYTMLPEGFGGTTHAAEIAFHPSGKACYATNRGEHSVVIYAVDETAPELHSPAWLKQEGAVDPQHVICDPSGKWLAVAWRTTDEVRLYPLDPQTLKPSEKAVSLNVAKPMCAIFVPSAD